ncbi:RNA polymerase factor sigma-54 [Litoribrevibacter albus]|uniref:RNA polymerase sigma-54 factor n=1 Tax=Litoribrevibacter albus TaxID=1473156 RepID=A0AA37W659_9GAMM|nr:RNA polymerase factor sigma-54 [Litoribrevibacter albus]GLQ31300.1 RNA polymerase sigma-54 factor [Litoribrevibacter albus]
MKTSLQLKMGQSLTMTPQLQQAIRLLQLSTLDLQQEIQHALENNPMLEVEEEFEQASAPSIEDQMAEKPLDNDPSDNSSNSESHDFSSDLDGSSHEEYSQDEFKTSAHEASETDSEWNNDIPEDLTIDTGWDDIYQHTPTQASAPSDDDDFDFESRNSVTETLQDHLNWQLNLTPMTDADKIIAENIIDGIDDDGYLHTPIEDICESANKELNFAEDDENRIDTEEVEAVLHLIQRFDPVGTGARSLQECLQVQLNQMPADTPYLSEAKIVVLRYLELLGNKDFAGIMRKGRIKEDVLKEIISLIQTLHPRPGEQINQQTPDYVVPDVIVQKVNGRWRVDLNPEITPKIRINPSYASLIRRADSSADNTFLKDHMQEAKWFLKSLQSRNETLLKVATKIMEHQRGFLDYGDEAMKPLVLHDIAEAVEMHESTISRVTTQKYIHTPRGIFELKYFFSSHVSTSSGGECSSTAIRAIIKKLVAAENPKKPLSDNKIATLLGEQGIKVARRTIAKYREAMNIPPSNERKRLV